MTQKLLLVMMMNDDEDENYEEKSKENLIKILIRQRRKLNEKDEIIEDLKADLKREKKLNDMMIVLKASS